MIFKPHSPKQDQAIFSDKKILAYLTGIQVGKTTVGALRTKIKMHTYTAEEDNFLVAAPTYKILQQSTLPSFLKFMNGFGEYSKSDAVFKMYGGGSCYMRTATEPDSIVGITNVRHIWVDEAGKVSLYFFENVMARSAFRNCQIDLTSSPYTLNWLYKQIVLPKMKDKKALPDVELIQAASWENPYMPQATIEHARQTMDARRFNALFGGAWERMQGLVYDCFDDRENICEPFVFPKDAQFFAGIDWGYTDPFVLVVHAILPNGLRFQCDEVYKAGLLLPDIAALCKKRMEKWGIKRFYADPSQPGSIEYLCRQGCPTIAADNDIRVGIDNVYEQLKTRKFKFIRGSSPHTLDEIEAYHYPEPKDLKPDQDSKEMDPVGQNDHACDALRYLCRMTTHSNIKLVPHAPSPRKAKTEADRIKVLMREKPTLT
jgi:Terminase-like family.